MAVDGTAGEREGGERERGREGEREREREKSRNEGKEESRLAKMQWEFGPI